MPAITGLTFVERTGDVNAFQGVCADRAGTYYYTSDSTNIYKYTRSGATWTLSTSRAVGSDDPTGKTQVNGLSFDEAGRLCVGANDFQSGQGSNNGWIVKYDADDLSPLDLVYTVGDQTCEGGAERNGEFFAVYNDSKTVTRHNAAFTLQQTYSAMPSGGTRTTGMYQSGQWMRDDILLVGWHGQSVWVGDPRIEGFQYNQATDSFSLSFSLITPLVSRQPQQVWWDEANDQLLIAERQTQTVARYDITYQALSGSRSPGVNTRVF